MAILKAATAASSTSLTFAVPGLGSGSPGLSSAFDACTDERITATYPSWAYTTKIPLEILKQCDQAAPAVTSPISRDQMLTLRDTTQREASDENSSTGILIGAIVGPILFLLLVILLCGCCCFDRCHTKKKANDLPEGIQIITIEPPEECFEQNSRDYRHDRMVDSRRRPPSRPRETSDRARLPRRQGGCQPGEHRRERSQQLIERDDKVNGRRHKIIHTTHTISEPPLATTHAVQSTPHRNPQGEPAKIDSVARSPTRDAFGETYRRILDLTGAVPNTESVVSAQQSDRGRDTRTRSPSHRRSVDSPLSALKGGRAKGAAKSRAEPNIGDRSGLHNSWQPPSAVEDASESKSA